MPVKYPFGEGVTKTIVHADFASSVVIDSNKVFIDATVSSAAVTLNLDIDSEMPDGAEIMLRVTQGATGRNVTLGTGFHASAPDLTGVASDVDSLCFEYWGGAYIQKTAAWQKLVDAA